MDHNELNLAIKRMCYKVGDFTLSSGKKSDYYLDLKSVLFNGLIMNSIASEIYHQIRNLNIEAIGGMELGAAPITAAFTTWASLIGNTYYDGFVVRKEKREHGTRRKIEGADVRNKNVCVVEDVCTSGDASMAAVIAVQEAGGIVKVVIPIVCRNEGGRERFLKSGYNYKPLFVVEDFQ